MGFVKCFCVELRRIRVPLPKVPIVVIIIFIRSIAVTRNCPTCSSARGIYSTQVQKYYFSPRQTLGKPVFFKKKTMRHFVCDAQP